ncbi:MAG: GntR family transcriptional regulator [Ruminococcaceae bacterium]|nr:GntR family transcriptional regulator [Oscillospiraceae bacterium]
MLIRIDNHSRTPIFEQIKEQILNKITLGELKPGDKLPPIRQLASDLNLNVNTIKRAFNELEEANVIYSVQGSGVFISEKAIANKIILENAQKEFTASVISAKAKGLTLNDAIDLVNKIYGKGEGVD